MRSVGNLGILLHLLEARSDCRLGSSGWHGLEWVHES